MCISSQKQKTQLGAILNDRGLEDVISASFFLSMFAYAKLVQPNCFIRDIFKLKVSYFSRLRKVFQ